MSGSNQTITLTINNTNGGNAKFAASFTTGTTGNVTVTLISKIDKIATVDNFHITPANGLRYYFSLY